jgi:hypothetical protein
MQNMATILGLVFEHLVLIVAVAVFIQLVTCYTIQTIADKQCVPHTWMAWVPLLQIYPVVRSGGSTFLDFLILMGAGVISGIALALVGPLGMILMLAWCVWVLVYFVRLMWMTAERRYLPGWVGLLLFIPLVNFLVYPIMAFHDGPVAPNRVGLVLGFIFVVLPAFPELHKARQLAQLGPQLAPMAAAAESGDERAMHELMGEMLETMQKMEGFEAAGDDGEAMSKTLADLFAGLGDDDASSAAEGAGHDEAIEQMPDVKTLETVSERFDCPEGTRERGAVPPRGFERWCELVDSASRIQRHGGYASWHRNGQLREVGLYQYGHRVGVWTRWYASGGKKTQAEFEGGEEHGILLTWDEFGRKQRQIFYQRGEPVGG